MTAGSALIPPADPRAALANRGLRYIRHAVLCFLLFSLLLVGKERRAGAPSDLAAIRAGVLRDLTAEFPAGRQAFVGSLAVMPLPGLAALPFLPFLDPPAYGYAYLYGLALLLALAALPLASLLRRRGWRGLAAAAPLGLGLACLALGSTNASDGLALLALLILAVFLETRAVAEVRALAGVFWALALLAHPAGFALAALRLLALLAARFRQGQPGEARAVGFIQGTTILYGAAIYLFLNGMIMGNPVYPFVSSPWWRVSGRDGEGPRRELALALARQYSDCRPVVSGVWGYAVQPLLDAAEGYPVLDYHPGKIPADETGPLVLVIPAGRNPYARFSDLKPAAVRPDPAYDSDPVVERTENWMFVRVRLKPAASEPEEP